MGIHLVQKENRDAFSRKGKIGIHLSEMENGETFI